MGGKMDYWSQANQRDATRKIRKQGGDSMCVDIWNFATLVKQVGCDNVHIRCNSSDVEYTVLTYENAKREGYAAACLKSICWGMELPVRRMSAKAAAKQAKRQTND